MKNVIFAFLVLALIWSGGCISNPNSDETSEPIHVPTITQLEGYYEEEKAKLYRTIGLGALKYIMLKVDAKKGMMLNHEFGPLLALSFFCCWNIVLSPTWLFFVYDLDQYFTNLSNLHHLEYLEIFIHDLTFFPSVIFSLAKLKTLKLGSQHDTNIPDQFNKLPNLH